MHPMFHGRHKTKDFYGPFQRGLQVLSQEGVITFGRKVKGKVGRLLIGKDNSRLFDKYSADAFTYSERFDATDADIQRNHDLIVRNSGYLDIKSINWFIPGFENPFLGGIHTALRFAAYFKRSKGVQNRFIVIGNGSEQRIRAAMGRAFPDLADEEVVIISSGADSSKTKESDASVATYWKTAYGLLQFSHTKRKFYLVQDLESLFYSGGSISGLVEATYRFGFYCIANTQVLKEIYERNYSGKAESFTPCVDTDIFFCDNLKGRKTEGPTTVFFYARPWHPRNGFELGAVALRQLKGHLGAKVRIVAAGGHWKPSDFGLQGVVENLGVLDYVETAALYRSCDVGLVLRFTPHPSYIPFELMASGCLVVSNFNSGTAWLLQDRVNCLVAPVASASCLCQVLERAILNEEERNRLTANAAAMIRESYADWEKEMEKIFSFMCDPA